MKDLEKIRVCSHLLPDPGGEVVRDLLEEINRLRDDMETAWGIIANAYHGDWATAPCEWKEVAERWRDEAWHRIEGEVNAAKREDQVRRGIADGTPLHKIEDALDQEENGNTQTRKEIGE